MPEPPAITIRVSQEVVDFRNRYAQLTGRKKKHFDEAVYREYMESHPLPDDEKE